MPCHITYIMTLIVLEYKSEQFMEKDQFHFVFVINLMGLCFKTATKVTSKTE